MSPKSNYFSQRIEVSKGNLILFISLFLLIGGLVTYFLFKKSFENEFSSYEGYKSNLGEFPIEAAKNMVNYYNETTPTNNRQGTPVINPRSIYFELGSFAWYLLKVKSLKGASGLRVYFGRYDKETKTPYDDSTYNFKDHSSVIFVGTKKNKDGVIEDILVDEKGKAILYQPYNGGVSCPPLPPRYCQGQGL